MPNYGQGFIEHDLAPRVLARLSESPASKAELADYCGCSTTSVQRALEWLRETGVRVQFKRLGVDASRWFFYPWYDRGHLADLDSADLEKLVEEGLIGPELARLLLEQLNARKASRKRWGKETAPCRPSE